jgi:hypothetical protein
MIISSSVIHRDHDYHYAHRAAVRIGLPGLAASPGLSNKRTLLAFGTLYRIFAHGVPAAAC